MEWNEEGKVGVLSSGWTGVLFGVHIMIIIGRVILYFLFSDTPILFFSFYFSRECEELSNSNNFEHASILNVQFIRRFRTLPR